MLAMSPSTTSLRDLVGFDQQASVFSCETTIRVHANSIAYYH